MGVNQRPCQLATMFQHTLSEFQDYAKSVGDNNHELCLDVTGTPQSVYFPAGHLTDPREDLNPETMITITE